MKRDFSTQLMNLDGKPFEPVGDAKEPPTLKDVYFMAVGAPLPGDEKMEGPGKVDLFAIASLIAASKTGVIEIDAKQLQLVKDRIGRAMNVFVVGASYALLERDYVDQAGSGNG